MSLTLYLVLAPDPLPSDSTRAGQAGYPLTLAKTLSPMEYDFFLAADMIILPESFDYSPIIDVD